MIELDEVENCVTPTTFKPLSTPVKVPPVEKKVPFPNGLPFLLEAPACRSPPPTNRRDMTENIKMSEADRLFIELDFGDAPGDVKPIFQEHPDQREGGADRAGGWDLLPGDPEEELEELWGEVREGGLLRAGGFALFPTFPDDPPPPPPP